MIYLLSYFIFTWYLILTALCPPPPPVLFQRAKLSASSVWKTQTVARTTEKVQMRSSRVARVVTSSWCQDGSWCAVRMESAKNGAVLLSKRGKHFSSRPLDSRCIISSVALRVAAQGGEIFFYLLKWYFKQIKVVILRDFSFIKLYRSRCTRVCVFFNQHKRLMLSTAVLIVYWMEVNSNTV